MSFLICCLLSQILCKNICSANLFLIFTFFVKGNGFPGQTIGPVGCKNIFARYYVLPLGSHKRGRSGVRCIMLGSGLRARRTDGGGARVARLGWVGRRMEVDGQWRTAAARRMETPLLGEPRNRRPGVRQYYQILFKKWFGAK